MPIKRLPPEVQSLLCASCQINTFKKVVEELVFNALDAGSTSIAIRVNIQEGIIQVIDNGCGIRYSDMWSIGQRHMTSNYVDGVTLRTAPDKYGLRGEALANIIAVSREVNIVTRLDEKEETWVKTFCDGKEKKIAITSARPSKGTTVEIKGFLYNLNIRKKTVNNIDELQNIRTFLEQLSLVHNNVSLSLRDDTKNEIIFQVHKNRDIYQTLHSLFYIERKNIQELSVEKNEYKVKGYIGKNDALRKRWIYLNGKCVYSNSKLYKIVNENLTKSLSVPNKIKVKSKVINDDENAVFTNKIPYYFIFISCPYLDYDTSKIPNQSLLEFDDWNKIKTLLEKLIKFYIGDINLKPLKKPNHVINAGELDTRVQVRKIINKVLGNKCNKPCISGMQNGIKGKLIKRKNVKKLPKISISKIIGAPIGNQDFKTPLMQSVNNYNNENTNSVLINDNSTKNKSKVCNTPTVAEKKTKVKYSDEIPNKIIVKRNKSKQRNNLLDKCINLTSKCSGKRLKDAKIHKNKKNVISTDHGRVHVHGTDSFSNNSIMKKFLQSIDGNKQRSPSISKEAKTVFKKMHGNRRQMFRNDMIEYNSFLENKSVSLNKKTETTIIHEYFPRNLEISVDCNIWKEPKNSYYKTTYDLVKTILNSQENNNFQQTEKYCELYTPNQSVYSPTFKEPLETCHYYGDLPSDHLIANHSGHSKHNSDIYNEWPAISQMPKLTYESHCYQVKDLEKYSSHKTKIRSKKRRFISKNTIDKFNFNENYPKISYSHKLKPLRAKACDKTRMLSKLSYAKQNIAMSSFTIEISRIGDHFNNRKDLMANYVKSDMENGENLKYLRNLTYTIPRKSKNYTTACSENTYRVKSPNYIFKESGNIEKMYYKQQTSYCVYDPKIKSSLFSPIKSSFLNDDLQPFSLENEVVKQKSCDVLFISNSQHNKDIGFSETGSNIKENIHPLDVCETMLSNISIKSELNKNYTQHYLNKSLLNDASKFNKTDQNWYKKLSKEIAPVLSEHFEKKLKHNINDSNEINNCTKHYEEENMATKWDDLYKNSNVIKDKDCVADDPIINIEFDIRDRHRFLPKGTSQIFDNCNTKTACDYRLDEDYFNDSIYDKFVNNVHVNSEIYALGPQNLNETATKHIKKNGIKLVQHDASLKFNGEHLKRAKILGQVEEKFIAALIEGHCSRSNDTPTFLVLFDQHAVHERIRLENNLSDYVFNNQWESVPIEASTLVLSKDEVISLHNYKEKFEQFGLKWTILDNNSVKINAVPRAILSNHPRELKKVIEAVKFLIVEETNVIKMQKGCISLYPTSIMDLVFSEACRYAIKFGDSLSKADCEELISNLSNCKTPFQCAHGRPVMVVVMNYPSNNALEYKINPETLRKIKFVK